MMSDAFPEVSQMMARNVDEDPGIDTVNDAGRAVDEIAPLTTVDAVVVQFRAET